MARTDVCPWWAGYTLNWSFRSILHSPNHILEPYLKPGMTALDIGCGMGYFTIPMAKMVGGTGRVVAADLQEKMLAGRLRNAKKPGVLQQIKPHQCKPNTLGFDEYASSVDFALAFMMVHEVPDKERLIREIYATLRDGGTLFFAEPIGHVGKAAFQQSLQAFERQGFRVKSEPGIAICRAAVLEK
ncbi:MAG: class I SAM-dependent methyltransferase [Oscillospiraceae bacterium]